MERESRPRAVLGIDPGVTGAVALLPERGDPLVEDWREGPELPLVLLTWADLYSIRLIALERVHSMPKQGVRSTFTFGTAYGWWQGVLDMLSGLVGAPWLDVTPQTWGKGLVPPKRGVRGKFGLQVARRLYPSVDLHLAKHHNRADALLIARWAAGQVEGWGTGE